MQIEAIAELIKAGVPDCEVEVDGDGTHFTAVIVSEVFAGKNMVQQHQLVYKALGDKMGTDIHALSIQTLTPAEWQKKSELRVIS
ncbi:MAG: BolA/IbaG family iron-sulfur metabolism protein [Gammaproteobacteria bacterium]|nr:BolA/IbaG family iron-sulfur metabolism protein [Gammaproteobacteria bacterium]